MVRGRSFARERRLQHLLCFRNEQRLLPKTSQPAGGSRAPGRRPGGCRRLTLAEWPCWPSHGPDLGQQHVALTSSSMAAQSPPSVPDSRVSGQGEPRVSTQAPGHEPEQACGGHSLARLFIFF